MKSIVTCVFLAFALSVSAHNTNQSCSSASGAAKFAEGKNLPKPRYAPNRGRMKGKAIKRAKAGIFTVNVFNYNKKVRRKTDKIFAQDMRKGKKAHRPHRVKEDRMLLNDSGGIKARRHW